MVVVAVAASACRGSTDVSVELAEVTSAEVVRTIAAPAVVEPRGRTAVTTEVLGEVAAVLVDDGDAVQEGDPLVVLESPSLDLQIEQAQAAVDAADALSGVQAGVDLSPLIGAVRGQLEGVVPDLLDGLEAQAEALPEGPARDEAQAAVERARASYEDSLARLTDAEQEARAAAWRASASQRTAAEAQKRQAEVALEAAREQTDGLTVTAPASGVIEFASADASTAGDVGELSDGLGGLLGGLSVPSGAVGGPLAVGVGVTPGQVIATIYDLGGFHVRAEVDEIDAVLLRAGQPATILIDALPDLELAGRVAHVAIAPERAPTGGVAFPVRVDLRGLPDDAGLRVGLTASVEIEVQRVESETVVPSSALLRRGGQEVVYVDIGGVAREVPVTVEVIGDGVAAISGEVSPGQRVVASNVADIEDGQELP